MPRLRNRENGAVVNVDDATAVRLGSAWGPADEPEQESPAKRGPGRPKKADVSIENV